MPAITALPLTRLVDLLGEKQAAHDAAKNDLDLVKAEIDRRGHTAGHGRHYRFDIRTSVTNRLDVPGMVAELGEKFVDRFRKPGTSRRWAIAHIATTAETRKLEDA